MGKCRPGFCKRGENERVKESLEGSAGGLVGMRSRASDVARLKTVTAPLSLIPVFLCVLFTFNGRATPDAQERVSRNFTIIGEG